MFRMKLLCLVCLVLGVLGAETESVTLTLGQKVEGSIDAGGEPGVFCYPGNPQFNIWHIFNEVEVTVAATSEWTPSVYGSSQDEVHGYIDGYIKGRLKDAEDALNIPERAAKRAKKARGWFPSPVDLLTECPPPWAPNSTVCSKHFSPFGPSCVAVASKKQTLFSSSKRPFTVQATEQFRRELLMAFAAGAFLLLFARFLGKSKILWYSSGMTLSVAAGLVILLIFICRRVKVPGSKSTVFSFVSIAGYSTAVLSFAADMLKKLLAQYWEFVLGYCALFAILGFVFIARIRRTEESKHDFRVLVIWVIRSVGLLLVLGSQRSGACGLALIAICTVWYIFTRLTGKKGDLKPLQAKAKKQ